LINKSTTHTTIRNEELVLCSEKAIFWPKEKALIISDAHLGKADHFRKSGIAVPQGVNQSNILRIKNLIVELNPERVIFLGDLFHSTLNAAWLTFETLINSFADIRFELVKGNHDILPNALYENSILKIYEEALVIPPFLLTHIPLEEKSELYNLAGHLHPGITLKGKAKQYLKLPCFYFTEWQGIVPAFGGFTGLMKMEPKKAEKIYVVSKSAVKQVK